MCGIAGLYSQELTPSEELLTAMADTMVHRGPDAAGTFCDGPIGLAHRRLSIIDLNTGDQPMFNEDRTLVLVFNGEIYDHLEHRRRLEAAGHRFATQSDSEVILHLYEEYGTSMVNRLNGMFAFALYDTARKSLFMARDRLGQKPLFYALNGSSFAFASGVGALTTLPFVDTTFDPTAINLYLELNYVPAPRSIYESIKKLPPGYTAVFENGQLVMEPYWQPLMAIDSGLTYQDAQDELRRRLTAAVERRLVADVPLGMFLSGGMDSSLICAIAANVMKTPPKTYSIGFADARYDEREYAEMVAAEIGCEHHFLEVDPGSLTMLESMISRFEEPFADSSMLPTLSLAEFTAKHLTVSLSGDGADELFGGYYRYQAYGMFQKTGIIPRALRRMIAGAGLALLPGEGEERTTAGKAGRLLRALNSDGLETYLGLISRLRPHVRDLIRGDVLRHVDTSAIDLFASRVVAEKPGVNDIMTLDLETYLPDDILVKVDRSSMSHSLEVRSPFLDPEVVDLALRMPYDFKQKGRLRKRILRDTFANLLPHQIFSRPKMGFGVPVGAWLRGPWKARCHELLLEGGLCDAGLFDRVGLQTLLQEHDSGLMDHSYVLFSLLILELWRHSSHPSR